MRARLASVFILIFLSYKAYTQVLVGPVAGFNYSWTSFGDKDLKSQYRVTPVMGYHIGGHLAFKVRKRFFLHTSLIYSTKGKDMTRRGKDVSNDPEGLALKLKYNYIEMPLVYTAYFKGTIGTKSFKYSLGIGPNVSYWLGGKGTFENGDTHEFHGGDSYVIPVKIKFGKDPATAQENDMVIQHPNRIQLGLNFTAGFLFEPARDREMVLTLRYELGHSYLSRESNGVFGPEFRSFSETQKIRNQGFRISLAYLIDLKVEERKKGKSTIDRRRPK
ncbi:MAG TPA: outer membrane beta-barrel protein [Ohtaekwangia sp.]|uniref:outer membrane beta-barrel protein n=1 Tax=Ohtaekwangia sp. TaxID=2066019 RepID=UPI002F93DA4B